MGDFKKFGYWLGFKIGKIHRFTCLIKLLWNGVSVQ